MDGLVRRPLPPLRKRAARTDQVHRRSEACHPADVRKRAPVVIDFRPLASNARRFEGPAQEGLAALQTRRQVLRLRWKMVLDRRGKWRPLARAFK